MVSDQSKDRSIRTNESVRAIDRQRRRFMTLLGAGALTAVGVPQVSAQDTEDDEDAREPDLRDVTVTTRDNIDLATDVYLPSKSGTFPTIVYRTPYNKGDRLVMPGSEREHRYLEALLENGYAIVKQDKRGRFKSDGEWDPVFFDQEDGYDTVEWAADQKWSSGRVGMLGGSYRAFTSWQAALADPPSLEAIAPIMSPANFYRGWQYKGGAFELGVNIYWTLGNGTENALSRRPFSEAKRQRLEEELNTPIEELYNVLPISENPAFDEQVAPYYFDWHLHDRYDEYWERIDVNKHIENVSANVLSIGGFYDIFLEGHTAAFDSINERGQKEVRKNQKLILGPWTHDRPNSDPIGERELPGSAGAVGDPEDIVTWFDQWLKDDDSGSSFPTVQYFQTGPDEWYVADTWPPENTASTEWYLNSNGNANSHFGDGVLTTDEPDGETVADDYVYDPLDPTPTTGGPILQAGAQNGVVDQREVEERDDVLVFTSGELEESVDVVGVPEVTLYVESTAPDTDFGVKLVDVEPDGYAANITEGHLRARYRETSRGESYREAEFMEPGDVYELTIDLRSTAHTFEEGHHIRLDITSSNFPRLSRNPNRAMTVADADEDDMQPATNTVYHDAHRASRVSLPIMKGEATKRADVIGDEGGNRTQNGDDGDETKNGENDGTDDRSDEDGSDDSNQSDDGDSGETDETDGSPGFGVGGALAGVGGGAYALKRLFGDEDAEDR